MEHRGDELRNHPEPDRVNQSRSKRWYCWSFPNDAPLPEGKQLHSVVLKRHWARKENMKTYGNIRKYTESARKSNEECGRKPQRAVWHLASIKHRMVRFMLLHSPGTRTLDVEIMEPFFTLVTSHFCSNVLQYIKGCERIAVNTAATYFSLGSGSVSHWIRLLLSVQNRGTCALFTRLIAQQPIICDIMTFSGVFTVLLISNIQKGQPRPMRMLLLLQMIFSCLVIRDSSRQTMNICTKFYGNPSNNCLDISVSCLAHCFNGPSKWPTLQSLKPSH